YARSGSGGRIERSKRATHCEEGAEPDEAHGQDTWDVARHGHPENPDPNRQSGEHARNTYDEVHGEARCDEGGTTQRRKTQASEGARVTKGQHRHGHLEDPGHGENKRGEGGQGRIEESPSTELRSRIVTEDHTQGQHQNRRETEREEQAYRVAALGAP